MSDDPTDDERTAALYSLTLNNLAADRDWWKMKYRLLARVLEHNGFEILEDAEGNPDIAAMRARGYLPPKSPASWAPDKTEH